MFSPTHYVSQTDSNHRSVAMWLLVATLSLIFVAVIVGAPLAIAGGYGPLGATIYQGFSHLCHQIPERSFVIAGHKFAVCARCTGIYAGFAAATLLYPLVKSLRQTETPARKWLFVAAAPLAIDWALEFFGFWNNSHTSRLITGALLGATAVFYVLPGLVDLSLRDWGKRQTKRPSSPSPPEIYPAAPSDYSAPHRRI